MPHGHGCEAEGPYRGHAESRQGHGGPRPRPVADGEEQGDQHQGQEGRAGGVLHARCQFVVAKHRFPGQQKIDSGALRAHLGKHSADPLHSPGPRRYVWGCKGPGVAITSTIVPPSREMNSLAASRSSISASRSRASSFAAVEMRVRVVVCAVPSR